MPRHQTLTGIDNLSSSSSPDNPTYSYEQYQHILMMIKGMRLRAKTRKLYRNRWVAFNKFLLQFDIMPKTWEERLHIYAAHLVDNKKQSGTVRTYITAIRQILKLSDIEIKEDRYLLSSLIKACKLKNDRLYIRMPIRLSLLKKLLDMVDSYYLIEKGQTYLSSLLKAMFSMAYFGMLRVSEMTEGDHTILAPNVRYAKNKDKILLTLYSSKTHSRKDPPQHISIHRRPDLGNKCPVKLIAEFVKTRGTIAINESDPFFVYQDNHPVTAAQFRACLKRLLTKLNVEVALYDTHGFRAGKAVDMWKAGEKIDTIKKAGRWLSDAIRSYLKFD